jgi:hypothetical protein
MTAPFTLEINQTVNPNEQLTVVRQPWLRQQECANSEHYRRHARHNHILNEIVDIRLKVAPSRL